MVSAEHKDMVERHRSSSPIAVGSSNHRSVSPRMIMDPVAVSAVDRTRGMGRVRTMSESQRSEAEDNDDRLFLPRERQRTISESALAVRNGVGGTQLLKSIPDSYQNIKKEADLKVPVSIIKSPHNLSSLNLTTQSEIAQPVNQLGVPCQLLKLNQQSILEVQLQIPSQSLLVTKLSSNDFKVAEFKIPAQVLFVSPIHLVSKPESQKDVSAPSLPVPSLLPAPTGPLQEVAGHVSILSGGEVHPELSLEDLLVEIVRTQKCLEEGSLELIVRQLQLLLANMKIGGPTVEIHHKVRFFSYFLYITFILISGPDG